MRLRRAGWGSVLSECVGSPKAHLYIEIHPFPRGVSRFDPEFRDLVSSFKQKVVVGSDNQQPFTLVVDLSRKEGEI
jgi:hypothetical protein